MTDAPLAVRVRAAHVLAGLIWAQAAIAAAGVLVAYVEGLAVAAVVYAGLAALGAVAGLLEWRRHARAEALGFLAFLYGVTASILALPLGLWYFVPFLGSITLAVMLALLWRLAVRSEGRHAPRAGHA